MSDPILISVFHQWHCDHFSHVNTRHYAALFDDAVCAFWSGIGADLTGIVPVTAQMATRFHAEGLAGLAVRIHAQIKRVGRKSVTLDLQMTDPTGRMLACCEIVEVFFNTATRQSAEMPDRIRVVIDSNADASGRPAAQEMRLGKAGVAQD